MKAKIASLKTPKILRFIKFTRSFFLGALVGAFILILMLTLVVLGFERQYQNRVYPGVFLSSLPASGETTEQLEIKLANYGAQIEKRQVILVWSQDNQRFEVTSAMIDFSFNQEETIKRVFAVGRKENGVVNLGELYRLVFFTHQVTPQFHYSLEKLEVVVASMSGVIDQPSQEALFEFKDGRVVSFRTSQVGRRLDAEETKRLLVLAFSQFPPSEAVINLNLPVKEAKPKVSTEQSNDLGIREALGEGESFFFDSIPSRIHNIGLASSRLHGVVVPPGEIFSFAQTIGEVTSQTGYQQAYVIKEKKTILEDGGGVCQVSTTLFRAALNTGLSIVERQPHYYRVGFYEQGGYPPGLDATVYPPSPDFKFKNDTPAYLLIQTDFDKAKRRLSFTFYGTSDGRQVEVTKPVFHSRTPPPEPTYIDDPTLPTGVVKQTDQAHPGAKVSFKRKVWTAGGELKEEREFWSDYVAWPAVYLRGIGP